MKKLLLTMAALCVGAQLTHARPVASPSPSPEVASAAAPNDPPAKKQDVKAGSAKAAIVLPIEKKQPVRIVKFDKAPAVDGKLDEDVWKTAAVFKDFTRPPRDNIAPRTHRVSSYDATTSTSA